MRNINLHKVKNELLSSEVFDCIKDSIKSTKITTEYKKKLSRRQKKLLARRNKPKRDKPQRRMPKYREYIKSEEWKKLKHGYFKRHLKRCAACRGDHRVGLHHITYKNLGNERDEDLVPLCWDCHTDYHERYGTKDLEELTKVFIQEENELHQAEELKRIIG